MYPAVVKAVAHDDFTLTVTFSSGEEGTLDMRPYLGFGVFQRIQRLEDFKRVRVAFDALEWDAGPDLDPEFVYSKCRIATRT